ncbi:FK506-binding protein 15 isoform X2 [Brachyhypopomus gauderio]|uniref:FK506-binding protein 15 isoform X2 n=1 Tax=Brachyhypopomus gauderio TaxID=698409 RepID=UPI00404167C4
MKEDKDFFPDYHDEDFLAPKSGAKLASLFDLDRAESQGNDSFQFIAPRQPKRTSAPSGPPPQKQAPPPAAQAVLLATAVHAFCFVNGQYVNQGKLGAAILGNHVTKKYKVLLYDSRQKQVTTAQIHLGFVLTVQPDNYMSFYDDRRQNWSLKFDSQKAGIDFCKEVCVARWNSQTGTNLPVTQDLLLGEGRTVDVGDAVKMSFSGWLLQSHAIGQLFDSSVGREKLLRLKLSSSRALKGLEQGMLGMQKGGRRLLVLPASVAYGSRGVPSGVPAASTVVFDVEICWVKMGSCVPHKRPPPLGSTGIPVERLHLSHYRLSLSLTAFCPTVLQVKLHKDVPCLSVGPANTPDASRVSGPDSSNVEDMQQSVLHVSSEQGGQASQVKSVPVNVLSKHPDAVKARLISRMAKMGQPMLPLLLGAIPAQPESSDSEMEIGTESGLGGGPPSTARDPPPSPQPAHRPSSPPPSVAPIKPVSLLHLDTPTAVSPPQVHVGSDHVIQTSYPVALQSFPSVCPTQHLPYYTADVSSFLLTEARQQDAEIRLSVARVADKVDQVAMKMDELQNRGNFGLSGVSLEAAIILHNIQRIIQENASLKKEVLEKAAKVDEQERKIGELTEQKQRYMEQSSLLLEQKNDSLQNQHSHDRLQRVEEEKVRLAEDLAASSSRVCELQQEVGCLQQRATETQAKLGAALQDGQSHRTLIGSLEAQVEELKNEGEHCRQQWKAEKQKCRKKELTVKTMEEEIQDLRAEKEHLHQILSDRKRKWQLERERLLMEQEEQRQIFAQENQHLLEQLRRARACTAAHPTQQERRRWVEEQERRAELEAALAHLQEQREALREEAQIKQQPRRGACVAVQVKQVMNALFHALKVEFDLQETYTGDSVLKTLLYMIKHVTMQFLKEHEESESETEDEADDDEEEEVYLSAEETPSEGKVEKRGESGI